MERQRVSRFGALIQCDGQVHGGDLEDFEGGKMEGSEGWCWGWIIPLNAIDSHRM
jgi:hypothetical protein